MCTNFSRSLFLSIQFFSTGGFGGLHHLIFADTKHPIANQAEKKKHPFHPPTSSLSPPSNHPAQHPHPPSNSLSLSPQVSPAANTAPSNFAAAQQHEEVLMGVVIVVREEEERVVRDEVSSATFRNQRNHFSGTECTDIVVSCY